ncbi:oligosaccharide flippase family protein [candidate division KSB1 bacterium]|nr:oligosaccharide flippase family protein [candidate division KSB1 bacterium]NIR68801.1 oligosaccharide flippase family protein [candidate division KSB1 bacterium]NIS28133.1 oligosaccharide flippase family protein [candidate division KSB1 bacterium]NIT75029.1 oligosaccharide flippase family protein [candidate division KSB1 bacterium]NIU28813.1 oligosaccharide flippase family protein [candidate division KSB1 bacterium]
MEFINNQPISQNLKRITKNAAIYSIGNIGVKIVSFLLIPLYTHYLAVYEVGIVVLLELLELFYLAAAHLGMINAVWRYFYQAQKTGDEKRYVASNYLFMVGANTAILLVLLLSGRLLARYFLSDVDYTALLQIFCIALFFGLSRLFILTLLRIYEKALQFISLVLLEALFLIGLTIWFVMGLDLGLWGVVFAKLIASGAIFVLTLLYVLKQFGLHYHHPDVDRSLRYGLPLVFNGLGIIFLTMADRYFIKELVSVGTAGVYGIAYKFGMIMNMVLVSPFAQAWHPLLFQLENHPAQRLTYQKVGLHFVQVGVIVWLVIAVGSKYLLRLTTTADYYSGIVIIPWIAFSYLLYGMQQVFKAGALIHNKTVHLTAYTLLAVAMNVILNLLLIPKWGMLGAAVATLCSYFFVLVFILTLSQKYLYINWRWKKMLSTIFLGVVLYFLSLRLSFDNVEMDFVKDLFFVICLPMMMFILKLVSWQEVKRFLYSFQTENLAASQKLLK